MIINSCQHRAQKGRQCLDLIKFDFSVLLKFFFMVYKKVSDYSSSNPFVNKHVLARLKHL